MVMALIVAVSCRRDDKKTDQTEEVLVSVNDTSLTVADVVRQIPVGLAPEDSAELFDRIVDMWVRNRVLSAVGEKNVPDMAKIEEMVADYRNELIVNRYLALMDEKTPEVSDAEVKKYYSAHRDEMILESPLVKGVYLKVADTDESLPSLRRWMASSNDESIDRIEKHGLREASSYEYFKDSWHEWNTIAEQIPYRFYDADAFVSDTKDFETAYGGSTYLLHISDRLLSGEPMPYEYAARKIREILRSRSSIRNRDRLMRDIYVKAMHDGTLKAGLYDPVKHTMTRGGKGDVKQDKQPIEK